MSADVREAAVSFDYAGMTAIVTGAARGVGRGIAALLASSGADVVAVDMDEAALAETGAALGVRTVIADVADRAQVDEVVEAALSATGRIDLMVNNAGILRDRRLWNLTTEDWNAVLGVHLTGSFNFIQACLPALREQGGGSIVNVTSYTGLHGNIGQANYAAAKAGIIGLTKTCAKELGPLGITVNAISPNADTRMIAGIPQERRADVEAGIPLGRFAQPDEIAAAVAFLGSRGARYITGVVLPVDGGLSM